MRDMVEIRPVKHDGDSFIPVLGDEARSPSKTSVDGPGSLQIHDNPHYVAGAYENLQHYKARKALEAVGLWADKATTHRLELDRAAELFPQFGLVADADGIPTYDRIDPMAFAIQKAVKAGRQYGATHIEIRIS